MLQKILKELKLLQLYRLHL